MPIVLTRVDDRLVHGQVVVGWGRPLDLQRIVLVDDEVRRSPWEQELYRMAAPREIEVDFLSAAEAAERLAGLSESRERVLLLTGSIGTVAELVRRTPGVIRKLNLGGIHAAPGRRERLRFLYLSDADVADLEALARGGMEIAAQDVPSSRPTELRELK